MEQIKHTWYCPEGKHTVSMALKNHINTAVKGHYRPCCNDCKARIQEGRNRAEVDKSKTFSKIKQMP